MLKENYMMRWNDGDASFPYRPPSDDIVLVVGYGAFFLTISNNENMIFSRKKIFFQKKFYL